MWSRRGFVFGGDEVYVNLRVDLDLGGSFVLGGYGCLRRLVFGGGVVCKLFDVRLWVKLIDRCWMVVGID